MGRMVIKTRGMEGVAAFHDAKRVLVHLHFSTGRELVCFFAEMQLAAGRISSFCRFTVP